MEFLFLMIPATLFVLIVLPLWIVFHHLDRWKTQKRARELADEQTVALRQEADDLWQRATALEERVVQLERILDMEAPQWRQSGRN